MRDASKPPIVLTEADFVKDTDGLGPRPVEPGTMLLIIAHTNVYGTEPAQGEHDECGARDFVEMALTVAQEFPEVRVGLFNRDDVPDAASLLPVTAMKSLLYAEGFVYTGPRHLHHLICGAETPDSLRLWLCGILLATGLRPSTTRDDLDVRLAYELAEPETYGFNYARWDEPRFRRRLYDAAKQELDRLTEEWSNRGP